MNGPTSRGEILVADYMLGEKYNLPAIDIFNDNGTLSEAAGVTDFVRQYTLASGGPYCDCGYKKKGFVKPETKARSKEHTSELQSH